jgi:dCTP diphosphatase
MDVAGIQRQLATFAEERDWDQFHSPKNLAMALTSEVGELAEIFQWLTDEESRAISTDPKKLSAAAEELADIQIYILRLADRLGIDIEAAVQSKLDVNARKYPIHLAKGNATKYNDRGEKQ